ncbi:MAG: 16S rRNA processing protein RimM [Chloroflexi bacterium]|jgi:16S rRNA processing protein RimM|nr:16S rRNA processing protein RimM [Anaerolineaceae bacterium]NLI44116.1 16S rRNA processing protein RimM [Chloroflexota bacterium]HOE34643.1 ribosome maturation factor RimM [Anaerolineaceae bacterium]HOT24833.1 ribosome maturation factor RimM [Anaerolineaceae bacterium]HQH57602.1 ribosome maturation factor RimM [Anaerolineaceae bacterium]
MNSLQNPKAGSDLPDEPAFALIGRLQRVHGVRGEIAMRVLTDFPQRLRRGKKVFLGPEYLEYVVASVRPKAPLLLLSFEGVSTREEAQALTNLDVFTATKGLPALPEGSYYHHQLIGLRVFEQSELLGEISEVLETGANDVFVVRGPDRSELLLPNIPSVILKVDLENGRMEVHVMEGLRG